MRLALRRPVLAALAAVVATLSCAEPPTAPERHVATLRTGEAASSHHPALVISQIYGGGGNSGATLRNDFIELFNPGATPVDVTGWRVGYASSAGTTWTNYTALSGSVPAGGYYLIQQAAGTGGSENLPTPDAVGTIAMAATNGKVVLLNDGTNIPASTPCPTSANVVDRVGFGSASNCFDIWGAQTPTLTNTTAAIRAENGCRFNFPALADDFATGAPAPRNTASPTITCGGEVAVPVSVSVEPTEADVFVGGTVALTATARDAEDNPVPTSITWSSDDEAIATVSATGVVTGVAAGVATITATTANELSATATITVSEPPPPPEGTDVLISQVYGGGGNSGAFYTHDFIELFNRGTVAADLSGWSVQYASAGGTNWTPTTLSGTIQPGGYFLVRQAPGAGGTAALPTPDAVGSLAMAAGAGKVILSNLPTAATGACPVGAAIVDRVGYGTNTAASGCEPDWGARTAQLSNTTAALRKNDGCVNTGIAGNDFDVLAPTPRNTASPVKDCVEPERPPSDFQIQINELMGDPVSAESASWGEWFEVFNYGATAIDMGGWSIVSGGTNQPAHVIQGSLVVPPGGYAVLGRGADELRNGGVAIDYNYFVGGATTIWLDDSDYLMLIDGEGARVDSVAWTSLPRGITKALRPGLGPRADVNGADWAFSTSTFGEGDYGTPGALNEPLSDTPPFVSPNRITVSGRTGADAPLPVGFEAQLFATLLDETNTAVPGATFTWASLTPAIGSVDARGVIRALAPGVARFRATAMDGTTRVHALTFVTGVASGIGYGNHTEFGDPVDDDPSDDFILRRDEFTSSWNGGRGIPNWVSYNLRGEHVGAGADRCNCFTFDPLLEAAGFPRYTTADYTGSGAFAGYGIDRGHLARSFDRTAGSLDNARTFYFSNIFPQAADNNQGPWAQHEIYLGDLARFQSKELWITAGNTGSLGTTKGEGLITIPEWTWKVSVVAARGTRLEDVRDYRDLEVVAVVMPNVPGIRNVNWQAAYVVTADSVEKLSGYRFLTALPAKTRRALLTGTQPPLGVIDEPVAGTEGSPITFSGVNSVDPNGTIVSYAWNLGDGNSTTGSTATHTYAFYGTYTARLIVTDNDGLADTVYTDVAVAQITPGEGFAALTQAIAELRDGGAINRGEATSMLAKLNAAQASFARGNATAAKNQLGALRNELQAFLRSGRLTAAQVGELMLMIERLERAIG